MEDKKIAKMRDSYTPPKLKEFGPVGALTQSGATGSKEASQSQMARML